MRTLPLAWQDSRVGHCCKERERGLLVDVPYFFFANFLFEDLFKRLKSSNVTMQAELVSASGTSGMDNRKTPTQFSGILFFKKNKNNSSPQMLDTLLVDSLKSS